MKAKVAVPGVDLSGLDRFSLSSLGEVATSNGQPIELPLDDVMEDPENARTEYDEAEMLALTESIRADKVREPISVKPKNAEGKYVINSGARRYRASQRAGKSTIPGFIDAGADEFVRFVVNVQRENLSPLDIANFIARHADMTHAQIAARIGKSREYVTQHAALLKLPAVLLALYTQNICRNPTALAELARLHKKGPAVVESAIAEVSEITGNLLRHLKDAIAGPTAEGDGEEAAGEDSGAAPPAAAKKKAKTAGGVTMQIIVKHNGKKYRLVGEFKAERKPRGANSVYVVKGRDDAIAVAVSELEFDSVIFKD